MWESTILLAVVLCLGPDEQRQAPGGDERPKRLGSSTRQRMEQVEGPVRAVCACRGRSEYRRRVKPDNRRIHTFIGVELSRTKIH